METVDIHEAKTHRLRPVEQAAKGKPWIIAEAGKPMVEVVSLDDPESVTTRFGGLEGIAGENSDLEIGA